MSFRITKKTSVARLACSLGRYYRSSTVLLTAMLGFATMAGMPQSAQAQSFEWVTGVGSSGFDMGAGIATDGKGDVYHIGLFEAPTMDFNPGGTGGIINNLGGEDIFIAKYHPDGSFIWVKAIGSPFTDLVTGIAFDADDNFYITGSFQSASLDMNPGGSNGVLNNTSPGSEDIFLAKYDENGQLIWAKNCGGTGADLGKGVAVHRNEVYITGIFNSSNANFNPGSTGGIAPAPNGPYGRYDVFLTKYDTSGNFVWVKALGGSLDEDCYSITCDTAGDVTIGGRFYSDTVDFNPGGAGGRFLNTGTGACDGWVASFNGNGSFKWAKHVGGDAAFVMEEVKSVASDMDGNVFVTGFYSSSSVDLNPGGTGGLLVNLGTASGMIDADIFLVKYDKTGQFLWARNLGGESTDEALDMQTDRRGNVYLSGHFGDAGADFNPGGTGGTPAYAGWSDAFVAKYNGNGDFLWVKSMGGTATIDVSTNLHVDRGNVYATGYFGSFGPARQADFNPGGTGGELTSIGAWDVFLVKFSCNDSSSQLIQASIVCGESYRLNDIAYKEEGRFTQTYASMMGCDSLITLELTVSPIPAPEIKVDTTSLYVDDNYAEYQWFLNDTAINGANASTYTVAENGYYKLKVTDENGCEVVTKVTYINNVFVGNVAHPGRQITLFPNPAQDDLFITGGAGHMRASVFATDGRLIRDAEVHNGKVSLKGLIPAVYIIKIRDGEDRILKTTRFTKQ